MKYYVDFEFNTNNEIISIGIIDDNGRSFSTLVKPNHRLTEFIVKLTGITNEDAHNAPNIYRAIKGLYKWMGVISPEDIFYVYGDQDVLVLKETIRRTGLEGDYKILMEHIINHSIDYSEDVQAHFKLAKKIKLIDVINYYANDTSDQAHDALEDARYLKEVVAKVSTDTSDNSDAFPEHKVDGDYYANVQIEQYDYEERLINTFDNLESAVNWTIETIIAPSRSKYKTSRIRSKIKDSLKKGLPYCGFYWRVIK